jgi:hypothetical protein
MNEDFLRPFITDEMQKFLSKFFISKLRDPMREYIVEMSLNMEL